MHALFHAGEEFQHFGNALVRGLHAQRDAAKLQIFKHAELAKRSTQRRFKSGLDADLVDQRREIALLAFRQATQRLGAGQQFGNQVFVVHALDDESPLDGWQRFCCVVFQLISH